jgi:hypothetical protein
MTEGQCSPNVDAGWRRLRDRLPVEQRARLYAGELYVTGTDPETGETVRTRLIPPPWLEVEDMLDR